MDHFNRNLESRDGLLGVMALIGVRAVYLAELLQDEASRAFHVNDLWLVIILHLVDAKAIAALLLDVLID